MFENPAGGLVIVWTGNHREFNDWQRQARRYETSTGYRHDIRVIGIHEDVRPVRGMDLSGARLVRYGTWDHDPQDSLRPEYILNSLWVLGMMTVKDDEVDLGLDLLPPTLSMGELADGFLVIAARRAG